jgi:hypothetical protein
MAAEVTSLGDYRPHATGQAHCEACGHRWVSVAPVGTIHLTCPSCEAGTGVWTNGFEPSAGDSFWQCNCGGTLFFLTPKGAQCRACGTAASWPNE